MCINQNNTTISSAFSMLCHCGAFWLPQSSVYFSKGVTSFHHPTLSPVKVSSSPPLLRPIWARPSLPFLSCLTVCQNLFEANCNFSKWAPWIPLTPEFVLPWPQRVHPFLPADTCLLIQEENQALQPPSWAMFVLQSILKTSPSLTSFPPGTKRY